jgi:hypothetical protein
VRVNKCVNVRAESFEHVLLESGLVDARLKIQKDVIGIRVIPIFL